MHSHDGVDRFNRIAATVFTELYEAFPDPQDMTAEGIASMAAPEGADSEEIIQYQESAMNVVKWLSAEGLLRYTAQPYGAFVGVILSMKGLTVLGSVPGTLRNAPEPFVDRLKSALSKGASEAATNGVKQVLGGVFDLALRYGQSGAAAVGMVA